MIKISAKYNDRKEIVSIENDAKKPCSAEAIGIIVEMYNMILKNQNEMTIEKINEIVKDMVNKEEN